MQKDLWSEIEESFEHDIIPARPKTYLEEQEEKQLKALRGSEGTFIDKYLSTYAHTTEAPDMILAAGALLCVSAAIGKLAWLSQGAHTLGLNNYILPIGPSGSNKSSAMNIARKHIERLDNVITLGSNTTPEALEKIIELSEGDPIAMFIDEYASLKAMASKSYGSGLESLMTEAYGGFITRQKRSKDADNATRESNRLPVYLNVYACTTPVWLNSALDDIRSGQLARYLMLFHGNSNKVIYIQPKPTTTDILAIDEHLAKIQKYAQARYNKGSAEVEFSQEAIDDIGMPWYIDWKKKLDGHVRREVLEPLQKRVDWIARKQAVLMYISDHPSVDKVVIPSDYLARSYEVADAVLSVYEHKLNTGWLADEDQQAIHKIKDYLKTTKGATEVELADVTEMSILNIKTIISACKSSGVVREFEDQGAIYYRLP